MGKPVATPKRASPLADTATELRALVGAHCGSDARIIDETTWESLGLDSLDEIQIELDIEERFGIPAEALTDDNDLMPRTFGALVSAVERLRATAAEPRRRRRAGHG